MQQWRIAAIVYFLKLCLALTVGMQVYDVLQASIGNSLEINKLLTDYDHTVVTDFLKVHGASITPLIGQLRWLLLAWMLFSVFTNGGLLFCITKPGQASGISFWQGGATYFFAFLKISLFFGTVALLWTAVIFFPLSSFFQPSIQYFSSEKYIVWFSLPLLLIWLTGLGALFVCSVLSRFFYLKNNSSAFASIRAGWQVFSKNKMPFLSLMALFAAMQMVLWVLYFFVEALTGMTVPYLILLVFLIQQFFVFIRIQIRQMMYAGIGLLAT